MKNYVCISAKTRKRLHVVVKVTSLLATILCVVYLVMVLFSLYLHRFLLHVLIISLFDDLYMNLLSLGVLMFLLSVIGYKLNRNLKAQPTNHSLPRIHRVWVVLMVMTFLANAFCVHLMGQVDHIINTEIGPRLKHGLSKYMDTPSWGSALDRVQNYLQCCGVHGPTDWYATAWIPLSVLSGHNVDYSLVQPTGRVLVPLVPSSCCRGSSPECGHKAWLESKTKSWADIKPADASQVHGEGCEAAIRDAVARDLLAFRAILVAVFVLQVIQVVAARYNHTSTINSVMLGRPQDSAPGWLVGPRLIKPKKRYGYLQVYDDRCHNIVTSEAEDGSATPTSAKSKWKCFKAMKCMRPKKGTESEGTPQSERKKCRLKAPCLAKLKTSCSKKFKKKKNKDAYVALESDTAAESESDMNADTIEMSSLGQTSRERMRTGGDYVKRRTPRTRRATARKKISENLIDVEDSFLQKQDSPKILRKNPIPLNPYAAKYFMDRRIKPKAPSKSLNDVEVALPQIQELSKILKEGATRQLSPNTAKSQNGQRSKPNSHEERFGNIIEPRKRESAVVGDFKKRRDLFEKAGMLQSPGDKDEVKIAMPPSFPHSLNLIDLDDVESARSMSTASQKNEVEPLPIVLRNYPPLPPSE